jgi:hypothetical protein
MIIKSPKKKDMSVDIHIKTKDGSYHSLDRKDHIKYLGVMIDASLHGNITFHTFVHEYLETLEFSPN